MMMLIWVLIQSPSDSFYSVLGQVRLSHDLYEMVHAINYFRLQCIHKKKPVSLNIQSVCRDWLPYTKCDWYGLDAKGLHYYPDSLDRFSPGSLIVRSQNTCMRVIVSSYGLIRLVSCDGSDINSNKD